MITVRVPAILRQPGMPSDVRISQPVETIGELVGALDQRYPGLASSVEDTLFNFAVNDALILHGARQHPLRDGDVVEIVPTISGG